MIRYCFLPEFSFLKKDVTLLKDPGEIIKRTVKRICRKTGYNRESKNMITDPQPGRGSQETKLR